ncbi:tRNA-specific 2-thiouridylase MnmA [Mycoplasmopsis canis PG 14]|uniref:tRNA-specific 2-thiouridylase MnmA n=1 Tax=Mycoplasmopsis canis TaxID=29555 RepID=A0A449ARY5_9BACT|nr:tRNA 2-thiouridine(34) synthase MnmA [Mycoplasmopsis canis]AMD81492.1 tRNA(5-methylaminomethyl-2-thiouridylate)-methyltransferase [Mycoplasmopsis canis PG 14]EIE39489.1 tRNA-specific 2-thiouridylase MnmA [Mycoplasmopsis canis PG 14]VEU69122.1 tRNA-specific 2-thiouridylase mnmA [Mycoplasmopsis canis]
METKKKRVVIGMSGGVDSSVAAYLLKQQGYDVVGLFMRNWDSLANNDILGNNTLDLNVCTQELDYNDAKEVAKKLNIPLHRVDFVHEYWDNVFQNFIEEYKKGRTPNPDILCNKYIKFNSFANYAFDQLEADYIAMGHYAKVENGHLYRAKDDNKDQTYFLAQLTNEQLKRVIMPLADLEKPEIRQIATELGLVTANKKDSTGICFIGERNFGQFLQNYIPAQEGDIIDITTNKKVGTHVGTFYYTIGQRKGLNLGGMSEPYYVCGHDVVKNILYVAPSSRPEYLLSDSLIASGYTFNNTEFDKSNLSAKFRYRQKDIPVTIEFLNENQIKVFYPSTSSAVTPGQQIVFYDGDKCIGGATIDELFMNNKKIDYL